MLRGFHLHRATTGLRRQWHALNIAELARVLTGRPPRTGEPEIDAILAELYSNRPQKFQRY
jgi:hypothetical protein